MGETPKPLPENAEKLNPPPLVDVNFYFDVDQTLAGKKLVELHALLYQELLVNPDAEDKRFTLSEEELKEIHTYRKNIPNPFN